MLRFIGFVYITLLLVSCAENGETKPFEAEPIVYHNEYVGAESCKECHVEAYQEWQKSDHFYAMKPANSESVKGNFETNFEADHISYNFSIRDQKYFVEVKENEVVQEYEVVYTFGHRPLQQYLVQASKGRFQTLRASWNVDKQKWFHQSAGSIIEPHDWLSWSKGGQNWNTMCSSCHSTHVQKNYDVPSDSFHTTYAEVNVACESCHGPGSGHIQFRKEKSDADPYVKLNLSDQKTQVNTCGTCHARRTMLEDSGDPHSEFLNRYFPQTLNNAFYEPDGQILEEDFVYGSFLSSKMYRNHVKCSDCHSSHSGQLKKEGNQLCLQCHESSYASETHHHHDGMSKGAQCVSCHMDGKTYMGNDYRRDHSFRIPRPDQSVKYETSNACNSCHNDQTPQWAASKVEGWFGKQRAYHFSDDLIPGSYLDESSMQHLKNLMRNDSTPGIVKATAIDYLQFIPDGNAGQLILNSSVDSDPLIRQNAYSVMIHFPNEIKESYAIKGLNDKIKAVRLMAFRCVVGIDKKKLSAKNLKSWNNVHAEYLVYLNANADFPSGQVMLGEYYQQRKDYNKSVLAFNTALKMDSLILSPYSNLAILYSGENDLIQVQDILSKGLTHFPNHPELNYYMGLNEGALGNMNGQLHGLKTAYYLEPSNVKYAYNYILTLYETKVERNQKESIVILSEALKKYPKNQKLLDLYGYMVKK